jgi:DNA-binding transcriptional ArsR family regulator
MSPFAALADETRVKIVDVLATRDCSVNDLVALFSISQPAISQHLKVLREAGLARVRPEAQRRIYSLDPAGLRELDTWLNRYRKFWANRLDRLEAHMDSAPEIPAATVEETA